MLSYRHSFHAGNFADLLKHLVLVEVLGYLVSKEKPFDYIDTHAGAGIYRLTSAHAEKTGEYQEGIARIWTNHHPALSRYLAAVRAANPSGELSCYPGSPKIAASFLRAQDHGWLFELHPTDVKLLEEAFHSNRQCQVRQQDGFQGLLSLLPPKSRRGVVLIDPSYELKEDYERVFTVIEAAVRKFATGIYLLWVPVVDRKRVDHLERQFRKGSIRNVLLLELGIRNDSDGHGMTSSCLLVVNPPWKLCGQMEEILPLLRDAINGNGEAFFRIEQLVAE